MEIDRRRSCAWLLAITLCVASPACKPIEDPEPLASWSDGPTKDRIVAFVERVTDPASPDFVPEAERVAVFDNDGTLWSERPVPFQLQFMVDRVIALAPGHPEWRTEEPFLSILEGHPERAWAGGRESIATLMAATETGMTEEEFAATVRTWAEGSRHPRFERPYTDLVYQPMLELLDYLRAHGFSTWIVSGGDVAFMRPWAEYAYGIPRERIIGSSLVTRMEQREGGAALVRQPEVDFIDDGPGKPIAIDRVIGRRPILAFGNSDGDLEMLEYTAAGDGPRLVALVHHTDAAREWAYDRGSAVGALDRALDAAGERGWTVVDMESDWRTVYAFGD